MILSDSYNAYCSARNQYPSERKQLHMFDSHVLKFNVLESMAELKFPKI
jgi:hypothetical protein